MKSGIILLDKAEGISSAGAISEVKRKLRLRKIGHAGTLDPFATGLLVCLVGHATRLASFAASGEKVYTGIIRLGETTTTDDVTGEVTSRSDAIPPIEEIRSAVLGFVGSIMQIPPSISALHVDGVRAYERVRERGEEVDLKARSVHVESFEISEVDSRRISFTVTCGTGTYIRSLARDLGSILGCGGTLESLRREASFPFSISNAKRIEDLSLDDIQSWDSLFPGVDRVTVPKGDARRLLGGDVRALKDFRAKGDMAVYCFEDRLLGLLVRKGPEWEFGVNFPYEVV